MINIENVYGIIEEYMKARKEEWTADWSDHSQAKYTLHYDLASEEWCISTSYYCIDSNPYMSERMANEICELLNNKDSWKSDV